MGDSKCGFLTWIPGSDSACLSGTPPWTGWIGVSAMLVLIIFVEWNIVVVTAMYKHLLSSRLSISFINTFDGHALFMSWKALVARSGGSWDLARLVVFDLLRSFLGMTWWGGEWMNEWIPWLKEVLDSEGLPRGSPAKVLNRRGSV